MDTERSLNRWRKLYATLLRCYPRNHRERFGGAMEQTFNDLLRDRLKSGRSVTALLIWVFFDGLGGVMREIMSHILKSHRSSVWVVVGVLGLLAIPLSAKIVDPNMGWSAFDFVLAGALLLTAGLGFDFLRKLGDWRYKLATAIGVGAALLLMWVNLAVGIIGSENNPLNLMFAGVLVVGVFGALWARLRPQGMARTLFCMALTHALAAGLGISVWRPALNTDAALWSFAVVLIGNLVFILLFLASGLLFQRAGRTLT